jgi:hypothetical protein
MLAAIRRVLKLKINNWRVWPPGARVRENVTTMLFDASKALMAIISNPLRSTKKSSTLRRDSGCRTYIITTRRMTSGGPLKHRNGLFMA